MQKTGFGVAISSQADVGGPNGRAKRTIPAFLQRLYRDDEFHLARRDPQVDALQFPLAAGGDCNPLTRKLLVLDQIIHE
jgi:hypothetical protein